VISEPYVAVDFSYKTYTDDEKMMSSRDFHTLR